MAEYVFGYGSLAGLSPRATGAALCGHRRRWGVAMDNRCTIPGYKFYVDARTGARPEVFVAFLDLYRADEDDSVNGVVLPVGADELAALDARERNYRRVDVTAAVEQAPEGGRVWTYVGTPDARERRERGESEGRLVVSAQYADLVAAGFEALGNPELARYRASTDEPPCPVDDLVRVDVPPG